MATVLIILGRLLLLVGGVVCTEQSSCVGRLRAGGRSSESTSSNHFGECSLAWVAGEAATYLSSPLSLLTASFALIRVRGRSLFALSVRGGVVWGVVTLLLLLAL